MRCREFTFRAFQHMTAFCSADKTQIQYEPYKLWVEARDMGLGGGQDEHTWVLMHVGRR